MDVSRRYIHFTRHNRTNPSPVYRSLRSGTRPPRGRSFLLLKPNIDLENQQPRRAEKKSTPCHLLSERGKPTHRLIISLWVRSITIKKTLTFLSPVFSLDSALIELLKIQVYSTPFTQSKSNDLIAFTNRISAVQSSISIHSANAR